MSPACWEAVFDILLTALELDEGTTGTTWVEANANTGYKGRDTAYADDLLSTTRDAGACRGRQMSCRHSAVL